MIGSSIVPIVSNMVARNRKGGDIPPWWFWVLAILFFIGIAIATGIIMWEVDSFDN